MKSYSTFAGAQRAANGKPIVRLLDDPREMWIVIDRLHTDVMVYTAQGRKYDCVGKTDCLFLASGEIAEASR